jgi:NAD(P)-dependent dehydrogenase (short-subunit alcohol dehydrogenase family)
MSETEKPFAGRLALVTGASRGIGAATAEALAAAGAHVILVARTASSLEEVEDRIHQAGGSATIAPLDLTDGENIGKLAAAVAERWQKLDLLVLNAAMLGSLTPVQDIDAKEYSRLLSLNLLANQALIAAFDPLLRRAEQADVVALTSSVGGEPRAFWGAYGSSKAALETLLGAYADETAFTGKLRVHIIDPGATRTRMRALAFPGEEPESVKPPEVVASAIVERLRAGTRTGEKMRVEA